jgi:hypothetical protein
VYNLNYTPTTLEEKVQEKLYLGVREQQWLNTAVLDYHTTIGVAVSYPIGVRLSIEISVFSSPQCPYRFLGSPSLLSNV